MFHPILIDLGELKPRKSIEFRYDYDSEVKRITNITTPCDCTQVTLDRSNKQIVVVYTPQEIPVHLRKKGYYDSIKTITISYLNTSDVDLNQNLVFTAKIKN